MKKDNKLEKAAQSGKIDFIDKIDGVKEATRVKITIQIEYRNYKERLQNSGVQKNYIKIKN